jgi:hypothetical protein
MEEKKGGPRELSPQEIHLLEQLRQQPQMMERFERILAIAQSTDGPLKTADEIEDLLIEEIRRLGNATLTAWATQAEERVGQELQTQEAGLLKRKKKR